jgi:hypothetical protein
VARQQEAEQRRSHHVEAYAEPLGHAEREPAGPPARHAAESHQVQDLIDAGAADPVAVRQAQQVVAGAAAAVERLGLQQRPGLEQRAPPDRVRPAADGDRSGIRRVQAEDQPHRGGLAGPVRPEEAGDLTGWHRKGQVIYGHGAAVPLGRAGCLDHRRAA